MLCFSLMDIQSILSQQREYYRKRAPEYDEWWRREGRFDHGADANAHWQEDVGEVFAALRDFGPSGNILEFAGGTGTFSQALLPTASKLTVVDASREMIELNRSRLQSSKVQYVEADIFSWEPTDSFDTVFFSFWLSHVPEVNFNSFWELVHASLAPDGRVFFIDSRHVETSTATNHKLPEGGKHVMRRKLNDGSEFEIIKVYYQPSNLEQRLSDLGWQARISESERYFIYGDCVRNDT